VLYLIGNKPILTYHTPDPAGTIINPNIPWRQTLMFPAKLVTFLKKTDIHPEH
jgi:hypothetical protein